ncbi:MAG: hypothetical protein RR144_01120 [Clostridia bacterium]
MCKRKLSDKKISELATLYATQQDASSEYLADYYSISKTTVSTLLHYAIEYLLVNDKIAHLIARKAISNDALRMSSLGYKPTKKVENFYTELLNKRDERKNDERKQCISELSILYRKYEELQNVINSYDLVFSSSDEFPYSQEDLEYQLEIISKQIQQKESTLI